MHGFLRPSAACSTGSMPFVFETLLDIVLAAPAAG